ncbi:MAG: hypothetical protein ACXW3O_13920, partial [Brevundimonas sp.]
RITASGLPMATRWLAEMRQACAEGRTGDAAALRGRIDAEGTLSNRWIAAQLMGDMDTATALLKPLDTPEQLPILMQFRINPTFDSRSYPLLALQLARNGAALGTPIAPPHGCPTQRP